MKFQKHTRALIVDVNLMWFQYLSGTIFDFKIRRREIDEYEKEVQNLQRIVVYR